MTPIIVFGYDMSSNTSKILQYLTATGMLSYKFVDCPVSPPRPALRELGIWYRRIPVIAIGKDVYCDTALQLQVLQSTFPDKSLPTNQADKAYEVWASAVNKRALTLLPLDKVPEALAKDRKKLFPDVLDIPNVETRRPSALAELKEALDILETQFLGHGESFVCGREISMADINLAYVFQRVIPYCHNANDEFPKTTAWLKRIPAPNRQKVPADEAIKDILAAEYSTSEISFDDNDPLQMSKGTRVKVEQTDDGSGWEPQCGDLIGASKFEVVLGLETGIRLHFPRVGILVRRAD